MQLRERGNPATPEPRKWVRAHSTSKLSVAVVEACEAGRFQVYAVESIQQALELLTGHSAGERREDGEYPEGTLLGITVNRAFES